MTNNPYQIVIIPKAQRDLKKLDKSILYRIDKAILKLSSQPRPSKIRKLIAKDVAKYRIRAGDYRILYDIDESNKRVIILRVGHRREIYR